MRAVIWDIDNCLADDSHRLHLINWGREGDERYAEYNDAALGDDPCHQGIFSLMRTIGCEPIFFTGRPERCRRDTILWLQRHFDLYWPEIYMRPDGTVGVTPVMLKRQMLRTMAPRLASGELQIIAAFDDLPVVVEMYRENGIPAVQLAVNDPEAAYEPADLVGAAE